MEIKMVEWFLVPQTAFGRTLVGINDDNRVMLSSWFSDTTNLGRYVRVPQEIRRCLFLDGNTVNVLLELVSWGMFDGQRQRNVNEWFAINQQVMALKTGLTENTISGKVKELENKMFIEKQRRGRRNYYKLNTSLNPFLVLSEVIHDFLNYIYPKRNYEAVMERATCLYNANDVDTFQEAVTIVTIQAVKDSDFYVPYIRRILKDIRSNDLDSTKPDYLPNYNEIVYDLQQDLMERIMRRFRDELKKQG
jgi:predicted transcriptional regulator